MNYFMIDILKFAPSGSTCLEKRCSGEITKYTNNDERLQRYSAPERDGRPKGNFEVDILQILTPKCL